MVLDSFIAFSYSTVGRVVYSAAAFVCLLIIAGMMARKKTFSVKMLTYTAICIALAVVLSYLKLFKMPYGGSVTACSMAFIVLAGFWFGPSVGLLAGMTMGLIQFAVDPYIVHPVQMFLDYPLAFGMLGLSGFFKDKRFGLYTGFIAGCLGRCAMSTLSGVVFFAEYAPEGMNPLFYSLLYNGLYIGAEMIISIVIISVPVIRMVILMVRQQATATA